MKKITIVLILLLILSNNPFNSSSVLAQTGEDTISSAESEGLLGRLSSVASFFLTRNNLVHLDNPKNNFLLTDSPKFTLIIPDKEQGDIGKLQENVWKKNNEEITASIIRKQDNNVIPSLIKKAGKGEFEISLKDTPVKFTGQYSLSLFARESAIYNRRIVFDFSWGDVQSLDNKDGKTGAFMKTFLEKRPEYKKYQVLKRDRNSVHFEKPDGKIEADFSAGPINYQDSEGQWKPIDTDLRQKGNELVGLGTPAKIKTDGTVTVNNQSHSQKTIGFGWFNPEIGEFSSTQELSKGIVEGDKFVRETKDYKHVLTLLDTGLKEELTLQSIPKGGEEGDWDWLVLETEITGVTFPNGEVDKEFKIGDKTFPVPTTKDARGKEIQTKRFAKKINNKQYIYTGIQYQQLKDSIYPLTIDPDYVDSTNDGYLIGSSTTYSTARSTSTSINTFAASLYNGQYYAASTYYAYRTYLKFDTSSIGTGLVTQVNLKLTVTQVAYLGTNFDVQIVDQDWSAQDPLVAGTREAAYDNCLSGTQDVNIWRNTSGVVVNTQYTSGNLNTTWVNGSGSTYYCLISSRDHDGSGTAPTGFELLWFGSQEHTTSSYRPVLTVTYTSAVTNTPTPIPAVRMNGLQLNGVKIN